MSEDNHLIKSSTGTAGIVTLIVTLVPKGHHDNALFIYTLSIIPPFLVWIQNWFWENGGQWWCEVKIAFRTWKTEWKLKRVMKNPLVQADHKEKVQKVYSKSKTDGLIKQIEDIKKSL